MHAASPAADSWDAHDVPQPCCPLLQRLVWPEADAKSVAALARCPRITLVAAAAVSTAEAAPRRATPSPDSVLHDACRCADSADMPAACALPHEADLGTPLDAAVLAPLTPLLDAELVRPRSLASLAVCSFMPRPARPHIAELFRLAFVERDARLQPKREKNARQNRRRALRSAGTSAEEALARCGHVALRGGRAALLQHTDSLPVDSRSASP